MDFYIVVMFTSNLLVILIHFLSGKQQQGDLQLDLRSALVPESLSAVHKDRNQCLLDT